MMVSLRRDALMRSMTRARATTRRLNTSVTRKMATRQPTVMTNASTEKKKRKSAICVLNSDAVKNVITCDRASPSRTPRTRAASDTNTVSSAMIRATCPRLIPSTW